ncbi:MAG: hypothetical protein R3Y56_04325 [Akkermansia sp.]
MSFKSSYLRKKFWIQDFLNGSPIRTHYREIRNAFENNKGCADLRQARLAELLKHAVDKSAFYKNCDPSNLQSFPVVNKITLQQNHDSNLIPEDQNPYMDKGAKYHIQKTSGSTGTPFAIEFDTRKRARRLAELKYFGEVVGFKSHDMLVHLRIWTQWQSKTKAQISSENIMPFDISNLNGHNLSQLCNTINDCKAKCLRGYASSFDMLAQYARDHKVKMPSLKIIIAGSETLYETTRELVHQHLHCDIISQYANEENGILAQESVGGVEQKFHLNSGSYIFEVLKMDSDQPAAYGELGRIVITDLFNYAFPVIRYDNGDNGVMEKDPQTGVEYISQLFGRKLDLVFNTQGEPVFPMVLARILKNYNEYIYQWQFTQKGEKEYLLKLITHGEINAATETEISSQLQNAFGQDADIKIEYLEEIPVLKSGKRKSVANEWVK